MNHTAYLQDWPALTKPAIGVLICNYNYARYVADAIESVLAQTRPAQRILVVDDGSTDDSTDVIARYGNRVEIHHRPNGGQIAAVNDGLAKLDADIVVILDADDLLEASALAVIAGGFGAGVVKLHFPLALIDGDGRAVGGTIPRRLDTGDQSAALRAGRLYASAPGSGNAYRRAALAPLLPLPPDPDDRHGADYFLLYGVSLLGSIAATDQVLGRYRVHDRPGALSFGNAHKKPDSAERRSQRLVEWLAARLGIVISTPDTTRDFSLQKLRYADALLTMDGYAARLVAAPAALHRLLPSIVALAEAGVAYRAGLLVWALLVAVLPYRAARALARYVCNPAARSARR